MPQFGQQLMNELERFSLQINGIYLRLPRYPESTYQLAQSLGNPLLRAGTSIGAYFVRAIYANTPADRIVLLGTCLQSTQETVYWLRLINSTRWVDERSMASLMSNTDTFSNHFIGMRNQLQQRR
jgi:four helix bundle protein